MTRACSARASVSVDFPASGWLMTANVLRRPASAEIRPGGTVSAVGGGTRALSVVAPAMVSGPRGQTVIECGAASWLSRGASVLTLHLCQQIGGDVAERLVGHRGRT